MSPTEYSLTGEYASIDFRIFFVRGIRQHDHRNCSVTGLGGRGLVSVGGFRSLLPLSGGGALHPIEALPPELFVEDVVPTQRVNIP